MIEAAEGGADVVCGSRYMIGGKKIGGPILQNILSRIVAIALTIFWHVPTTIPVIPSM
jgi:hypothetical protein